MVYVYIYIYILSISIGAETLLGEQWRSIGPSQRSVRFGRISTANIYLYIYIYIYISYNIYIYIYIYFLENIYCTHAAEKVLLANTIPWRLYGDGAEVFGAMLMQPCMRA